VVTVEALDETVQDKAYHWVQAAAVEETSVAVDTQKVVDAPSWVQKVAVETYGDSYSLYQV
jgi:hypothetical protein